MKVKRRSDRVKALDTVNSYYNDVDRLEGILEGAVLNLMVHMLELCRGHVFRFKGKTLVEHHFTEARLQSLLRDPMVVVKPAWERDNSPETLWLDFADWPLEVQLSAVKEVHTALLAEIEIS